MAKTDEERRAHDRERYAFRDDPKRLQAAIAYLMRNGATLQ